MSNIGSNTQLIKAMRPFHSQVLRAGTFNQDGVLITTSCLIEVMCFNPLKIVINGLLSWISQTENFFFHVRLTVGIMSDCEGDHNITRKSPKFTENGRGLSEIKKYKKKELFCLNKQWFNICRIHSARIFTHLLIYDIWEKMNSANFECSICLGKGLKKGRFWKKISSIVFIWRYWWRMLETKCAGDQFEMMVTD